jgi:peroxiredoxin
MNFNTALEYWMLLSTGMLGIGDNAPNFTLTANDRTSVTLSDCTGQRVVLAFYPAAFTGVCKAEMCTFTESMAKLDEANATIFGISVDSPFSNNAFAEENGIGFKLLSDVTREVIAAYGVRLEDFVIDGFTVAQRAVFIIEADGTIGYTWIADSPGTEPDYDAVITHCLNS